MADIIPFPAETAPSPPAKASGPKRPRGLKPGWNPWPGVRGGQIWLDQKGLLSFHVDRRIGGRRYQVNLQATDPKTAISKYRDWEENPDGWSAQGKAPVAPVYLDDPGLLDAFVRWCAAVPDGERRRRNTDPQWIAKKKNYLAHLAPKIQGRNLRSDGSAGCLTTEDVVAILRGEPNWRQRVDALGSLYKYLRLGAPPAQRVRRSHSPMEEFERPKPDPRQLVESKVDWSKEDSDAVIAWLQKQHSERRHPNGRATFDVAQAADYLGLTPATVQAFAGRGKIRHEGGGRGVPLVFQRKHLDAFDKRRAAAADTPQRVALALMILGGTAWHAREVVRFSRFGRILDLPADHRRQNGAAKALLCFHKSGNILPTAVSQAVADAAAELQRLGGITYDPIFRWTKKAVDKLGVAKFTPGRFRHRQGTYQVNQGAALRDVRVGLGHENEATTLIYTMRACPPKQKTWY